MELSSNNYQKRTIDCISIDSLSVTETQWFFAALCLDYIDSEFLDDEECSDIRDYRDVLRWCTSILGYSPSARLMLKEVCEKDWKVTLEDLRGGDYCVDVEQKLVILDNNALEPEALAGSTYFKHVTLVTMIKALRDIWQEKRHGGFDEIYGPEHILLLERVRAADLDALAILVAWELREEEYPDIWKHVIGSDLGDMAMSFCGYIERDPTAQHNGQALVATFKQWFRDVKRIDGCDHDTLEYMDDVLVAADTLNPFGKKRPTKLNVEILSCLPDKTAYLQGLGGELLNDPVYSAVDNPINQTHLFHIMYDLEAYVIEDVPFRDAELARKIFPDED